MTEPERSPVSARTNPSETCTLKWTMSNLLSTGTRPAARLGPNVSSTTLPAAAVVVRELVPQTLDMYNNRGTLTRAQHISNQLQRATYQLSSSLSLELPLLPTKLLLLKLRPNFIDQDKRSMVLSGGASQL